VVWRQILLMVFVSLSLSVHVSMRERERERVCVTGAASHGQTFDHHTTCARVRAAGYLTYLET
jgi:hypothetical protein